MMKSYVVNSARKVLSELFPKGELSGKTILAGLSGGADSVALVLALYELSKELEFSLSACHINHMIRGEEANRDEQFSRDLCKRLEVPFHSEKFDVPEISRREKKSLEEAARDVRYSFFEKLCEKGFGDYIATAHTASDNAETLIFNITRGCGLSGICGIPKKRGNIIRPLLNVSRADIEKYLSDIGQDYVTDSTNLADDCSRNLIRHRVIPSLCEINPAFCKKATDLSVIACRENDFLDSLSKKYKTDDITELSKIDRVLRSRIIGSMYKEKTGHLPGLKHLDMLCMEIEKAAISNSGERKQFNLPMSVTVVFECGKIRIACSDNKPHTDLCEYDIVALVGVNPICGDEMLAVYLENNEENEKFSHKLDYNKNIYSLFMETKLFSDIIRGKIRLRSGLPGDKIKINGMSKDIKKIYSAKKVPVDIRKYLPRICDGETGEILSLPYVGACDSQNTCSDRANICIKLYKKDNKE